MNEGCDYRAIHASSLGTELDDQQCQVLATIMELRNLNDGDILVAEGESDTHLYVLVAGKLAVVNTDGDDETIAYIMNSGECAGTRAFVDRTPRKATLRAVGGATVYALHPEAFETLLDSHPRIVYKVMRAIFRATHVNLMRMNLESKELINYVTKTHGRY